MEFNGNNLQMSAKNWTIVFFFAAAVTNSFWRAFVCASFKFGKEAET